MANVPPCKNCNQRGCGSYHDQCTEFQEFKKRQEKVNKKRRIERYFESENKHRK